MYAILNTVHTKKVIIYIISLNFNIFCIKYSIVFKIFNEIL
jgi:hypothetical protein